MEPTKRVCLFTGANGRLGTAFCQLYRDQYDIVAAYRTQPPDILSQLQHFVDPLDVNAAIPENEHPAYAVQTDLSDDRSLSHLVDIALARFGRIDVLVNSAADLAFLGSTTDCNHDVKRMLEQMHLNALVPMRLAATVGEKYWKFRNDNAAANRSVVNVSSTSGLKIFPFLGQSVYSASKAALNCLSRHMAQEFMAFGVRVNVLAPTSFPRRVSTESVANALHRLAQANVNGEIVVVDREGEHYWRSSE